MAFYGKSSERVVELIKRHRNHHRTRSIRGYNDTFTVVRFISTLIWPYLSNATIVCVSERRTRTSAFTVRRTYGRLVLGWLCGLFAILFYWKVYRFYSFVDSILWNDHLMKFYGAYNIFRHVDNFERGIYLWKKIL